jgi:hypothetical protein
VIKFSDATGNRFEGNTITAGAGLTTFEFRDGAGNIVAGNTPSGQMSINTIQSTTSSPAASTLVRNAPLDKSIVLENSLPPGATTTVEDTRSYVWQGSRVVAAPSKTSAT